jgi:hypothetical protein
MGSDGALLEANALRLQDELRRLKTTVAPLDFRFEIGGRCSFHCLHCRGGDRKYY